MVIAWIAALLIAEGTTKGPPFRVQVTVDRDDAAAMAPLIQRLPTACVT